MGPTSVFSYCNACDKKVTALVMVPPDELITALEQPRSIRVMHTGSDGDHVWSLSDIEKDKLRNAIAKGAV